MCTGALVRLTDPAAPLLEYLPLQTTAVVGQPPRGPHLAAAPPQCRQQAARYVQCLKNAVHFRVSKAAVVNRHFAASAFVEYVLYPRAGWAGGRQRVNYHDTVDVRRGLFAMACLNRPSLCVSPGYYWPSPAKLSKFACDSEVFLQHVMCEEGLVFTALFDL